MTQPWIGDESIRPVALAAKALAAEMREAGTLPADETVTVVTSIRPDGHGRVCAFVIDLLGADEDLWVGDALVSEPWSEQLAAELRAFVADQEAP